MANNRRQFLKTLSAAAAAIAVAPAVTKFSVRFTVDLKRFDTDKTVLEIPAVLNVRSVNTTPPTATVKITQPSKCPMALYPFSKPLSFFAQPNTQSGER